MARHGDTVWRVCLTALCRHADAEDAFQNSFLKYALADDVQFREEEHRKAWLIRVASNTCRDMRRAAASKNVPLDETSFESLMSRDEEAQPDSRVKEVLDAMSDLDDPPRGLHGSGDRLDARRSREYRVFLDCPRQKDAEGGPLMTDLEQRIREAYDAQHASEALRGRTLALLEEERKRRPDAPSVEVHRASLRRRPRARVVTAWAACLLLALALVGAYGVYRAPSAFVDIEVNPSLELTVNTFGIVIEAEALNDDGAVVLGAVDMLNRPYGDVIGALLSSDAFGSYAEKDAFIDVNVVSENNRLGESLVAQSDEALSSASCEHACRRADSATRDAAAAAGLGVGRYQAAQELMSLDPSYTLEECASMTMRQLRDRIDACHSGQEGDSYEGHGHGQGAGKGYGHGRHGN